MTERERLIQELRELDRKTGYWHGGIDTTDYDILADFIIADLKRLLNEIISRHVDGNLHHSTEIIIDRMLAALDERTKQ